MRQSTSATVYFAGVPLDRHDSFLSRREPDFMSGVLREPGTLFIVLCDGSVLCEVREGEQPRPAMRHLDALHSSGLALELQAGVECAAVAGAAELAPTCTIALLGRQLGSAGAKVSWVVAADASSANAQLLLQSPFLAPSAAKCQQLQMVSGRGLYRSLSAADTALCGFALAATAWQASARFCGRTGLRTVPIEAGAKRETVLPPPPPPAGQQPSRQRRAPRWYPRIDPCVIVLVTSVDNQRCLLSRPSRLRKNIFTCTNLLRDGNPPLQHSTIVCPIIHSVFMLPYELPKRETDIGYGLKLIARYLPV